jgi:hypothetical protein
MEALTLTFGTGISLITLAVILWVNFGRPAVNRHRKKFPFRVAFRVSHEDGSIERPDVLTVPAYSEVKIEINRWIEVAYEERMFSVRFEGEKGKRPDILSFESQFIERGLRKRGSPETDRDHCVTVKGAYQIRRNEKLTPDDVRVAGFVIRTHQPGRYPVHVIAETDAGDGEPTNGIILIVTDD